MNVLRWFQRRYDRRCRQIDLDLLWPTVRRQAPTLDDARAVFSVHCMLDPAWQALGADEICRVIDSLV